MAWEDPIITEVRQIREKLLEEAGGFEAYVKKLQKQEQEHPECLIDQAKICNP